MTEAESGVRVHVRPNIIERARMGLTNRFSALRDRLLVNFADFGVNQIAEVSVRAAQASPRVEEIREYFGGGVRDVARNLANSIGASAESLGAEIRAVPQATRNSLGQLGRECQERGVLPTLVSRVGNWIERTTENLTVEIPARRREREAQLAEDKVQMIREFRARGVFGNNWDVIDATARVTSRLTTRSWDLREEARNIRENRIAKLQRAIDRLSASRPFLPEDSMVI